ncbi:MEDS domain-containing protein [Actinoallomurus acanthiterrae]
MRPGDHGWLPFVTAEHRRQIVGGFVRDGLSRSEKVVCIGEITPERIECIRRSASPRAVRFLEGGRLRLIHRGQVCGAGGRPDPDLMASTVRREIDRATDEGYRAIRLSIDFSWALRRAFGTRLLLECEDRFDAVVGTSAMAMAICQIDRGLCSPDQLAVLGGSHQVLVVADPDFDDGILRITRTFVPSGLRIEGDIDRPRHVVFAGALTAATSRAGRVHLDLSGAKFLDLGALTLLVTHTVSLPPGHELALDNLPPHLEAVIDTVGWHRLPGVARVEREPGRDH